MNRSHGIQRRLINLLAIGALAIATASTLAILALHDLGRSFGEVSSHELPGMVRRSRPRPFRRDHRGARPVADRRRERLGTLSPSRFAGAGFPVVERGASNASSAVRQPGQR